MTEYVGQVIPGGVMDLLGGHDPRSSGLGTTPYSNLPIPPQIISVGNFGLRALDEGTIDGSVVQNPINGQPTSHAARCTLGLQDEWFERVIVVPNFLALGNILSSVVKSLELVNLFRSSGVDWTAFNNNAGAGISPSNLPGLPNSLLALDSFELLLEVTTNGPPTISGNVEFVTDWGTIQVPITGSRIILFPFQPNINVRETLEWNTSLLVNVDGSEQRARLRRAPRQLLEFEIQDLGDNERDRLNAMLFDWQARVFGVPIWWEQRILGADMVVDDVTVQVDTTFADFRVGGLVMLWDEYNDFESFEISGLTSSTITLQTGIASDRKAGQTIVLPVRTANSVTDVSQRRYLTGPTETNINFTVLDNVDLSDVSSFTVYDSRIVMNKLNKSGTTKPEGLNRILEILDDGISPPQQRSSWTKSKPRLDLRLKSDDQQEIWEMRQLLHYLGGRHTSFWMGTGRYDLHPILDIPDLGGSMDIDFVDFTTFYQQALPRRDFQIVRKDGTRSQHKISGSVVLIANQSERLTFTPVVSPALPLVDVKKIEFLTLSRLSEDSVEIVHARPNDATFEMQTTGLFA